MSVTSYEIVKYNPAYKNQVIELQKHLWSTDVAVNTAYFEWKYERNPYMDTPFITLALCEGWAVGMGGMFGAKWQVGNPVQTFLAPCFADSVVAPDHRGHGLYKKLSMARLKELCESHYTYNFVLSANPISCANLVKMGWRSVGDLQTMSWEAYHRIISHCLRSYLTKLSFLPSPKRHNPFHFLDDNTIKRRDKINPYLSVEQRPRPEAMAELVERIGYDGRIRHVRDKEYFSWRFNNPLSRYRFLFWEEERLEGYLILQTKFNNDTLRVNIVDWESPKLQVKSDLLEAALRLGNFNALTIWTATLPDAVKVLLGKNGFRVWGESKSKVRFRHMVLARSVRDDMLNTDWTVEDRRLLDLSNWDLRMIYSDGS